MRNIILSGLLLVCANSYAVTCTSGCNDVYLKIEQNLASNDNDTGAQINSNAITTPGLGMKATHNGYLMQWAKFNGDPIPAPPSHATNWQFKRWMTIFQWHYPVIVPVSVIPERFMFRLMREFMVPVAWPVFIRPGMIYQ